MSRCTRGLGEEVLAAEVIAALSLATDLGIGAPPEHGELAGTPYAEVLLELRAHRGRLRQTASDERLDRGLRRSGCPNDR
jgi:hypothetical protein